ncbi:MAG: 4-hydroxy-2-oxo-heptane-1,7-dioate aldolase [Anaerolineae bacterium]|nr:4-hydroxy-2-oxo-heptane-1,7-dioate aldolase [Anaerolineae bacterium]
MTDSVIAPNLMKQALQQGKSLVGTMVVEIRQPSVMQLLANAGFDFVIIDNEHGSFNVETLADLTRTALYVGLTPIVRPPDLAYPYLAQVLDGGAQGIMLPRIYGVEQVQEALQIMKYPPVGRRGNAMARGFSRFLSAPPLPAMARSNQETMLIAQIETKEAVANIDEIAATPGVDVALIGPNDLSISLGVGGQLDSPVLHQAIETTIAACLRHGVYPAIHINETDKAVYWAKKGMRVISTNAEIGFLVKAGAEAATAIRQGFLA